jgi:DNA polymerase-1
VASNGRIVGQDGMSATQLQQIPRGPEYRCCVRANDGKVLVKADYSQIELRIAAKLTGDTNMIDAYARGEDIHTATARSVVGIQEVTREHQLAKALNFGLLYGMGAKGFRNYAKSNFGVILTLDEATQFRTAFFNAYPGLKRWHRSISNGPTNTRTLLGRRQLGVENFTEKLNIPVQGTGADGLKQALGLLWRRRHRCPTAGLVLAVHDEIVVECDANEADAVAAWLTQAMIDAMAPLVDPVPVEVDVKIGQT